MYVRIGYYKLYMPLNQIGADTLPTTAVLSLFYLKEGSEGAGNYKQDMVTTHGEGMKL